MIAKIHSFVPYGFDGKLVEVEGDMNRGLPAFNIVGMANKTINEAKERVRSAIINSGFSFPDKKITINLAPAELQKDGAYLDLPIALTILTLSGQLISNDTSGKAFVGELSLNGEIKPVKGIINIVEEARKTGFKEIYVPYDNIPQASLVSNIVSYGVKSLQNLFLSLKGQTTLDEPKNEELDTGFFKETSGPLFDHIRGQKLAKRAMEIAIAGHHNILISGPPGAGKTLLAKAAANLLPDLTPSEIIDTTKIYSIAGLATDRIITKRPFRCPHHSASMISIIGGGATAMPGEISLAHKGILFLDEIPEFSRSVLEALRQPLEDKTITISRVNHKSIYPADFMLVATMNPCPCGYLGDPTHECKCTENQIQNYQKKLSGPLFDRMDMSIEVEKVENRDLRKALSRNKSEHNVVKNTILEAITFQKLRYGQDGMYNSSLSSYQVTKYLKLEPDAERLLASASERLALSARSYIKIQPGDAVYRIATNANYGAAELERDLIYKGAKSFRRAEDAFVVLKDETLLFKKNNIPTPRTITYLPKDKDALMKCVEEAGGFPVIIKVLGSSHGAGVMKIDSFQSLITVSDYLRKSKNIVVMKEYCDVTSTARLIVLGNKVIDSVEYTAPKGDFRSNEGIKPNVKPKKFDQSVNSIAVKAVHALGLEFGGVDIMVTSDGSKVAEVNSPCFFPRCQMLTGVDIASQIVEYLVGE